MATILACPTCGRATEADTARFCGGCGELLRPRGSGPTEAALPPDPADAPVERLDDPWSRRRVVAAVVAVAALALAVTAVLREPVEVVTADGLGTASGRTSNLAVTDLSTEHWRVPLFPPMPEETGGWANTAALEGDRLVTVGSRTTTVDLATGEVLGVLPPMGGTPVLRDGLLVAAIRDRLIGIDPADGTVTELLRLDGDVAAHPVFPHPVQNGWVVLAEDGISSVATDGTVRWTAEPLLEWNLRLAVEQDSIVIADWAGNLAALDLGDGSLRWETDRSTGHQGPDRAPLTADGLVFGLETAQELEGRARPSTGIPTARDAATGEIVWQTEGPLVTALIGVRAGVLYVATQLDPRPIHRIDVATGSLLEPVDHADSLNPPGLALLGPPGALLVGGSSRGLRAIDDRTGALRWETERGEGIWSSFVLEDLVLLSGSGGIQVLDGADGTLVQQLPGVPFSSHAGIAVSGRTAMVAPGLAVDVADGRIRMDSPAAERWSTNTAVPGGFVIRRSGRARVVDVNGAERWDLTLGPTRGSAEVVAAVGDRALAVDYSVEDGAVRLVDRDGHPVGDPLEGYNVSQPVVLGDLVVGQRWRPRTGRTAGLVAIRVTDDGPELVWEAPPVGGVLLAEEDALYEVSPVAVTRRDLQDGSVAATVLLPRMLDTRQLALIDGRLLAALDDVLLAIDPGTGAVLWERPLDARITAGPRTAGAVIAVGTETGDVVLLDLDGTVVASRDAAEAPVREVVMAHGLVLVATDRHAFALGPETLPERTTEQEPTDIGTVDVPVP